MTGGDPTLGIFEALPQLTKAQMDGALTAIGTQPQQEWRLFGRMLGLSGEPMQDSKQTLRKQKRGKS